MLDVLDTKECYGFSLTFKGNIIQNVFSVELQGSCFAYVAEKFACCSKLKARIILGYNPDLSCELTGTKSLSTQSSLTDPEANYFILSALEPHYNTKLLVRHASLVQKLKAWVQHLILQQIIMLLSTH